MFLCDLLGFLHMRVVGVGIIYGMLCAISFTSGDGPRENLHGRAGADLT